MANTIFPSPIFESRYVGNENIDAGASQAPYPVTNELGLSLLADGVLTNTQPVEVVPRTGVGAICFQFVPDFYNRIHINPAIIPLGNLVSSQFRQFDVWNAYFTGQLLSSITTVGDATGIVLTEPVVPPTEFKGLEVRTYDLNFATSGPVVIDVQYIFNFPSEAPPLGITGNRAIIFAFAPDWGDPVVDRYEWLTQIIEVEEGSESRFRLRANPRRSIEYRFLMDRREKRVLETYMWGWKSRVFAVPLWQDCARTTGVTPLGATSINVVTTDTYSFVAGQLAIFVAAYNDVEAVEILNVNATSIDVVRPTLIKEWAAGSRIYPALSGRMQDNQGLNQPTADVDFGNVKFEFLNNLEITPADSPVAYEDGFVLDRAPNRAEDIGVSWQSKYGLVDFGIGVPQVDDRAGFPDQVTDLTFAEGTREDVEFWKGWLTARAGKWSKFYLPSWSQDFTLVDTINALDVSIDVEDNLYRDFYQLHPIKRDIAIYTTDGQVYYRRVGAASLSSPDVERLTINAPLGTEYAVDEVKMISFLHPTRLNTDHVEIQWGTNQMAEINFSTRAVLQ